MPNLSRKTFLANVTIQFENPLFPPQWGAPALITTASIIVDENDVAQGQQSQHAQAAIASDITDQMLEALQIRLALLGLRLERLPVQEAPAKEGAQ